jgi:AraC family transcriptional regulator, regulatory protein of adaptative response / DNA-3-methyladenine glycosylase II
VERYAAVVTTGIYCRPGCSARPHAENVRAFKLAAAAEAAGYRACLRCRPYRWPQPLSWDGPELVCRAVRLILDGALDGGAEAELGARLGVSPRHLRRLFAQHLGVTPDGLARSARVHFARRLLDDSDLSVTEIAFAAGFGSLRQFNRACRQTFRESPRALRARRRRADRLAADGGLVMRLEFLGPLDWRALLEHFARHAIPGVEDLCDDSYRRTIVVDGDPGVLDLSSGGADHLLLRAHLPHWDGLVHLVQRVRRIANLDFPLEDASRALRPDPLLGPLLRRRPGVRPPGTWDPFESGVLAIVAHESSVPEAVESLGRLVRKLGTRVPGLAPLGLTHIFPSPETVASAVPRRLGLTAEHSAKVHAFARAVIEGGVPLDGSASLERMVDVLTRSVGLDLDCAHMIALRLGERDAWPRHEDGSRDLPAGRWRPWRAHAATHLALAKDSEHGRGYERTAA